MLRKFQNKYRLLLLLSIAGFILDSCTKDFVEPDLGKATVTLLAPANGYETTTLTHMFWWGEVKDAGSYNLQVVSPSFSSIHKLHLDTNLTSNKFTFSLAPGLYEWRVKVFNSSSESSYSIFSLKIDSTVNLNGQMVVLNSPANNLVTNQASQTFKWDTLYNATEYRFQIINSVNVPVVDVILLSDTAKYTLSAGVYTWQVRAQNATSNSLYTSRTITVDLTAPIVSVQTFPAHNATLTGTDSLVWTRSPDAIADSIFIYSDSLFAAPVKAYATNTTYDFVGTVNQDYFWRLKSGDVAGNWSAFGTLRKFWVK